MLPIDLVLVRHGQSDGNKANRQSESGDDSTFTPEFKNRHSSSFCLTDLGQRQAMLAGNWIINEFLSGRGAVGFDRYLTSEYDRAMETAARMNLPNARWYRDVYLTERNWGDMDILSPREREEKFSQEIRKREVQPFFWRPPNGESFVELCLRVDRVLHTLHRECSDKRVIIVCHGEVMQAFRVRLERICQLQFRELTFSKESKNRIHNCQVNHYTRRNPYDGTLEKRANWVRFVRPADNILPSSDWSEWRKIERHVYSNEELLAALNVRQNLQTK